MDLHSPFVTSFLWTHAVWPMHCTIPCWHSLLVPGTWSRRRSTYDERQSRFRLLVVRVIAWSSPRSTIPTSTQSAKSAWAPPSTIPPTSGTRSTAAKRPDIAQPRTSNTKSLSQPSPWRGEVKRWTSLCSNLYSHVRPSQWILTGYLPLNSRRVPLLVVFIWRPKHVWHSTATLPAAWRWALVEYTPTPTRLWTPSRRTVIKERATTTPFRTPWWRAIVEE